MLKQILVRKLTTHFWSWIASAMPALHSTKPGVAKERKRGISRGIWGHAPSPPPLNIFKVETKICAIWGILEANVKKSSTLKFTMNISFVPSIFIHRLTRTNRPVKALVYLVANQRTPHNPVVVQSLRECLYSASGWFTFCALFTNFPQTCLSIG